MEADKLLRSTLAGIAAGLAAAWIMNRFQDGWSAITSAGDGSDGDTGSEPATVKAADKLSNLTSGEPISRESREAAGAAVHYAFGSFLGGAYGLLSEIHPKTRAGFGMAYGAAVSLVADEIMVPATGLSPPPQEAPVSSHVYGFLSHLVFGATLEAVFRVIERTFQPADDQPA